MDMNVGSDRRIDLLVAMAGPGSTFATGAHDPFGGTFTGDNGFPGGPAGGPPGGPDGPTGPVVADLGKPRGPRDVSDLPFNPRDPGPIIEEQKPRVSDDGGLDSNTVQQYIRRYLRGVKACYQDGLQANPKLGGGMTLEFTILPSGGVLEPRIARSTLGDAALEQCVVTKMGRWSFPAPKNGGLVEVSYRLVLKAR
ncbi:MAG: AgmX/PglI C-terminal domain-containing protein [Myxococcota bacterium]